jgi:hypothetical protein
MNSIIDSLQLEEEPKPPVKAATTPTKKANEPKIPYYYADCIGDSKSVRQLRSQIMVNSMDLNAAGKKIEELIRHNLTVSMLKELESHIKIERMQDGFTEYGQTMFIGKLDVVEWRNECC